MSKANEVEREAVERDSAMDLLEDVEDDRPLGPSPNGGGGRGGEPLITPQEITKYRARWDVVQGSFIDDPHRAVEQADNLVDMVLQRLTDTFAYERDQLVRRWDRGGEPVSTEDMRVALQGYRNFLDRLLAL